ncbi:MAG: phosphoribosylformylglycinamidine synthase subunit PurL [Planctomycetes bacterium]|nr:phosphoribosylformylglycinamidine synthase subunit PurL [Planctomycetota bacterium]
MQAWRVDVLVRSEHPDPAGGAAKRALAAAGVEGIEEVRCRRGYLLAAALSESQVREFTRAVLCDPVLDQFVVHAPGAADPQPLPRTHQVVVKPRAGVTDPVAHSVQKALGDMGLPVVETGTYRVFDVRAAADATPIEGRQLLNAARRALANDVVQEVLLDHLPARLPGAAGAADLGVHPIPLAHLGKDGLEKLSADGGLALDGEEMLAIQAHFAAAGRAPMRMELETLAQTWSEHCKHKTLTGRVRFEDGAAGGQSKVIDNLLRSTIAHVTRTLDRDFCVSVFVDNAGIIKFDDEDSVCIKVETHNRPSAIEPFGGAGTGVGGVIRDVLGTGLGARPIANTDVFCFAPPDLGAANVPQGCLSPLSVMKGVVAGVRDYGNPMGIPTVNGSVHFDENFVGNPLVYVGNIGILPTARAHKKPRAGNKIVALGGRTGRDGIHGATFSSLELHTESETTSSGAVQIGDPITERKAMDAVMRCADEDLFDAITDCGAGGFSSAIGEMAEELGAEVELQHAPLKYQGLAPWEVWISEAQERMVLAVPPDKLERLLTVCREEACEATVLGTFTDSGRLVVRHAGVVHADLDLKFLHKGLPVRERQAKYQPKQLREPALPAETDLRGALLAVMGDYGICSKEWIVRQYDHEVQAASAGKPLCGVREDGPSDAAVLAPKLGSRRGVVLANGLNPRYSHIDPAAMAECSLDEAMRNLVAAGGDPDYTAVLDNYCWGSTKDPLAFGDLVRATDALCALAITYRTPFVSGKDSLHNEFRTEGRTIRIPGCILVTAMSVIDDVTRTLTTDFKRAGSLLVLVGLTKDELGGSVYYKTKGQLGANAPRVDHELGKNVLRGCHAAIAAGCALAAHDLSEGGVGAAVLEMAIGGRRGARVDLDAMPTTGALDATRRLFSESQSRILMEIDKHRLKDLQTHLGSAPFAVIGEVTDAPGVTFVAGGKTVAEVAIADAERAWKAPLDLDGTLLQEVRS